jgi:hypothetical protein
MLSQEKNERLTAVGPDTPMGNLLRRYWWPVAGSGCWPSSARTAGPLSPSDVPNGPGFDAVITAGCSTRPGAASMCTVVVSDRLVSHEPEH